MLDATSIIGNHDLKTQMRRDFAWEMFCDAHRINHDGTVYVKVFDRSDSRMPQELDTIKKQGFRWIYELGCWTSSQPAIGVQTSLVNAKDIAEYGSDGKWHFLSDGDVAKNYIKNRIVKDENLGDKSSGFLGTVGQKLSVKVTIEGEFIVKSKSDFGDFHVLLFKDKDGNRVNWFQRTYSVDTVRKFAKHNHTKEVIIEGKVKQHQTRFGTKNTDLTRCEILIEENGHKHELGAFARKRNLIIGNNISATTNETN